MKKKEIATALGLSVALTMTTGCASQDEINTLNTQITELQAQVTELQESVNTEQAKVDDAKKENSELETQVTELQGELQTLSEELENSEVTVESADSTISEMSINITKYTNEDTAVYLHPEESEGNKIEELELNTEVFVVANFSGLDNEMWSAIGTLKTTDANGDATYQIISSVEKSEEKVNNKNVDFMFRKCESITVAGKTIKADELQENQEIRIVYARTSLLSNSKVTEQQHTSAEKGSTPKQQTPSQTAPAEPVAEGWGNCITPGCPSMTGVNLQFH